MNRLSLIFSLGILSILLILNSPIMSTEADTPPRIVDIATSPSSTFIDMNNLKPGDSINHDVRVQNTGNTDFSYVSKAKFNSGSQEYFNKLLIIVRDSLENILYSGNLKDFNSLQPRKLTNGTEEKLFFEVKVPGDLDNSFQGLSTSVLFTFSAQDNTSVVVDTPANEVPNGSTLPKTATNNFDLLLIGLLLLVVGTLVYVVQRKLKNKTL